MRNIRWSLGATMLLWLLTSDSSRAGNPCRDYETGATLRLAHPEDVMQDYPYPGVPLRISLNQDWYDMDKARWTALTENERNLFAAAVREGAALWGRVPTASLRFREEYDWVFERQIHHPYGAADPTQVVSRRDRRSVITLGTHLGYDAFAFLRLTPDGTATRIGEFDTTFDKLLVTDQPTWGSPVDTMAHEIGHGLGMNHAVVSDQPHASVMSYANPYPFRKGPDGENLLQYDDVATISWLYPNLRNKLDRETGTIVGEIVRENGSPVLGAKVIALDRSTGWQIVGQTSDLISWSPKGGAQRGTFMLNGLPPGIYDISVRPPEANDPAVVWMRGSTDQEVNLSVDFQRNYSWRKIAGVMVRAGEVVNVRRIAVFARGLKSTLSGLPIPSLPPWGGNGTPVDGSSRMEIRLLKTREAIYSGLYKVVDLLAGKYEVRFQNPGGPWSAWQPFTCTVRIISFTWDRYFDAQQDEARSYEVRVLHDVGSIVDMDTHGDRYTFRGRPGSYRFRVTALAPNGNRMDMLDQQVLVP